jgi:phosphate transport system protein
VAATHTDKAFEQDLRDLRNQLLTMGGMVEKLIARSAKALSDRDVELARQVQASDVEVNRLEVDIDEMCRRILALRQPAASDLRFITTALKIVTDLERCGDLAVNIAGRAIDLAEAPAIQPYAELPRLAEAAQHQLTAALDAFVSSDVAKAEKVLSGDEYLDALYAKFFSETLAHMMEDSKNIRRGTGLLFVAKHLERIGDHAVNVAEMVIFLVRGTDIRHPRSRGLIR